MDHEVGAAPVAQSGRSGVLSIDWDNTADHPVVTAQPDLVPEDVQPAQFFAALINRVLAITPIAYHVPVRERRDHRDIPVEEADAAIEHETYLPE